MLHSFNYINPLALYSIDHFAHVVANLEKSIKEIQSSINCSVLGFATSKEDEVHIALLTIGNTRLELIEPYSPPSPIGRFLKKRGPSLHHVALNVENLSSQLTFLKSHNFKFIDVVPRKGAFHPQIAFIHPSTTHGLLIELCESTKEFPLE